MYEFFLCFNIVCGQRESVCVCVFACEAWGTHMITAINKSGKRGVSTRNTDKHTLSSFCSALPVPITQHWPTNREKGYYYGFLVIDYYYLGEKCFIEDDMINCLLKRLISTLSVCFFCNRNFNFVLCNKNKIIDLYTKEIKTL